MKMHKRATAAAAATSTECKEPSHLRTYVYANISLYQRISVNCRRSFRLQNGRGEKHFLLFKRAQPEEEEETGQHSDASCEGLAGVSVALSLTAISMYSARTTHFLRLYRSYSATAAAAAAVGRKDWRCEKEEKGETQVYFLCRKKESSCYMATCLSRCWR